MPFNVLLLPLLGGFALVTRWNYTRFKTKRYSGERLIFYAAIAGVFLLMGAFLVVRTVALLLPGLQASWHRAVPFAYAGTSLLAFFLGLTGGAVLNLFTSRDAAVRAVVEEWNDFLELLLDEAISKTSMVSLTLKSGKVYVGFITSNFDPAYDRKYIRLWPILSGYRDSETQEMKITTNYSLVYAEMDSSGTNPAVVDDFQVIVPVGEVQSANLFDPRTYDLFNPQSDPVMP
ncbi:MAG: hypothetical protein ICV87_03850 [Gemmatimonadetes bacterium]|nr:hypothetical protein [Gemmatimonadota bacterium]